MAITDARVALDRPRVGDIEFDNLAARSSRPGKSSIIIQL